MFNRGALGPSKFGNFVKFWYFWHINLNVTIECYNFDSNLTIEHQIKHVVKKCFFHIRNIGKIRKFLTVESCKVLVNSLVISQLDYCNSIYYGLPSYLILRLQRVQNTAARLISCSHKYDHITPVLIELHWLPIEYRLKFKILLHVFKVINNLSPTYLTDLITHQPVPSRSLEMATAQRTRPRAVVGAPRRVAWQLKSALRHSISAAPRTKIFLHFFYNYCC